MNRQEFVNGLGVAIAGLLGGLYFFFSFVNGWAGTDLLTWAGYAVGATFSAIVVLTILFRPSNLWLYPMIFAAPTLLFGLVALTEPIAAALWLGEGALVVGVGYGFGKLTEFFVRRARATT